METLKKILQRPNTPHPSPTSSSTPSSNQSRCSSPAGPMDGPLFPLMLDNVRRLAVNLYSDLLSRLLKIINRSIKPDGAAPHSLILLDSPGLQGPKQGDKSAAGFSDLCYNYLQERLHLLLSPAPTHGSQGLSLSFQRGGKIATSNPMSVPSNERRSVMTNLIDRTGPGEPSGSKTGSLGRRASRRVRFTGWQPGLLALLHRAASCPWSDDSTFVQRLLAHWQSPQGSLVEACGSGPQFLLHHLRGSCPVRYDATGWRLTAHNMGRTNLATELLRHTHRTELRQTGPPPLMSSSVGDPGAGNSLEEVRARMSCLQVRAQVDAVVKVVTGSSPHFVLCLLPHHLAGLSEILRADRECALNQRLLREQVEGAGLAVYVAALQDFWKREETRAGSQAALMQLMTCHSSSMAMTQPNPPQGLATELWHGLQAALLSVITSLDMAAISGLAPPTAHTPLLQALDDAGQVVIEEGRVSLASLL